MNLPNLISLGRVLAVPLTVWLMIVGNMRLAFWVFLAAGLSDAIDGYLAKRFNATTQLGRYLDPIADKVLLVTIYVTLGQQGHLPLWLVILVVSRDFLIIGGALLAFTLGQPLWMRPLIVSKANTALQIGLAALVLGQTGFEVAFPVIEMALILLVATTTLLSGATYLVAWVRRTQGLGDAR